MGATLQPAPLVLLSRLRQKTGTTSEAVILGGLAALPAPTTAATTPAATTTPSITLGTKAPAAVALPDLAPIGAGNVSSPTPGGGSSQSYCSSTGANGAISANGNTGYVDNEYSEHDEPLIMLTITITITVTVTTPGPLLETTLSAVWLLASA